MRIVTKALFSLILLALVAAALPAFANPSTPKNVAGDLDRPVSAYDASFLENGETPVEPPPVPPEQPPPPEIFGEPLPGRRILFIIDRSCSMAKNNAFNNLKSELFQVLDALQVNNTQLKATWQQNGQVGDEPKIEIGIVMYSRSAILWKTTLTEVRASGVTGAKSFVSNHGPSGNTNWSDGMRDAQTLGGVFDTIYFMSDGYPNEETSQIDVEAGQLAGLHATKAGGMVFIAQYFSSDGGSGGRARMQSLADFMGAKPNVDARYSDAVN